MTYDDDGNDLESEQAELAARWEMLVIEMNRTQGNDRRVIQEAMTYIEQRLGEIWLQLRQTPKKGR